MFVVNGSIESANATSSLEQKWLGSSFDGTAVEKKRGKKEEKKRKRKKRRQDGCSFSEELLRVAYVTAISFIPRFIFLAPCYIPSTLRPAASPHTTITSTPTRFCGGNGC